MLVSMHNQEGDYPFHCPKPVNKNISLENFERKSGASVSFEKKKKWSAIRKQAILDYYTHESATKRQKLVHERTGVRFTEERERVFERHSPPNAFITHGENKPAPVQPPAEVWHPLAAQVLQFIFNDTSLTSNQRFHIIVASLLMVYRMRFFAPVYAKEHVDARIKEVKAGLLSALIVQLDDLIVRTELRVELMKHSAHAKQAAEQITFQSEHEALSEKLLSREPRKLMLRFSSNCFYATPYTLNRLRLLRALCFPPRSSI
jgi:hypothetical protein